MASVLNVIKEMLGTRDKQACHDAFLMAKYAFEKNYGNESLAEMARKIAGGEVENWSLSDSELEALRSFIMAFLRGEDLPWIRKMAVFALRASPDRAPKEFFLGLLEREFLSSRDLSLIYELLIALDDLGERVFSRTSVSVLDSEANLRDAESYLRSQGYLK